MILRGKPEEEISKIVAEYKACFAKREVAYEEKETETWFKQPFKLVL
jgi:hypothetical protein